MSDHSAYARLRDDPLPFALDSWPAQCGFAWLPGALCWAKGDYRLTRLTRKCWRLSVAGQQGAPRLVTTLCRVPEAIAADLTRKVREMTGGRDDG